MNGGQVGAHSLLGTHECPWPLHDSIVCCDSMDCNLSTSQDMCTCFVVKDCFCDTKETHHRIVCFGVLILRFSSFLSLQSSSFHLSHSILSQTFEV